VQTVEGTNDIRPLLARELDLLKSTTTPDQLLPLLRVVHRTMMYDRGVNYSKIYEPMGQLLLARFPSGHRFLDREIARTLAHLDTAGAIPKIVAALEAASGDREQQIFFASCLRVMKEGWEPADRKALVQWFRKTQDERWKGGSSFAGFIQVMWDQFLENQPPADQQAARAAVPSLTVPTLAAGQAPAWRVNEAASISEQEMREYLLYDPMAYAANAERGRKVYEKAACIACHRFGDIGQEAGPDLTDVAKRFKRTDLLDAILYPSQAISDQWAAVEITTRKNETVLGVVQAEDAQALTVLIPTGAKVRIPKRDIRSREQAKVSPMPEGLLNGLSMGEVRDLFAFLEKGP
jgi:putative heme-binding domain-containing protein